MKMKPCRNCDGEGYHLVLVEFHPSRPGERIDPYYERDTCYIYEGTGTIPDEPVSHCAACGEPIIEGEWCEMHKPAADLWQALNQPEVSQNMKDIPRFYVWHTETDRTVYLAKRSGQDIDWTTDVSQASLFTLAESQELQQTAPSTFGISWECSFTHHESLDLNL